tara:strand:+ start:1508 stop:2440 length:933 start_codon:yes stop_codon:yes gene_type:complete
MLSESNPLIKFEKINDKDMKEKYSVLINSEYEYSSQLSDYVNIFFKYHNIEEKSSSNKSDFDSVNQIKVITGNKTLITLEEYINLFGLNGMVSSEKNGSIPISSEEENLTRNNLSTNDVIKLIFDFTVSLNILKDIGLSILKINSNDFHVFVPSKIYNNSISNGTSNTTSNDVSNGIRNKLNDEDKREYINEVIFIYTGSVGNGLYPIDDKDNINIEKPIEFSNNAPEMIYFNKNKTLPYNFNIRTSYYVIALFIIDLLFVTSTEDEGKDNSLPPEKLLSLLEPLYYTKLYYFLLRCLQPNINDRYFLFV